MPKRLFYRFLQLLAAASMLGLAACSDHSRDAPETRRTEESASLRGALANPWTGMIPAVRGNSVQSRNDEDIRIAPAMVNRNAAVVHPTSAASAENQGGSVRQADWIATAVENPDPAARLHALEIWAQNPQNTLDPLMRALADPDESIRMRAEQLWEEARFRN